MTEKILIVDDDPYSIQGISVLLEDHYDVYGAFSKSDMKELLNKHAFALTILDLDLKEDGHGLDLIEDIQTQCDKVLVLTSVMSEANIMECLRKKVNGIMAKKGSPERLLPKVQSAIAGQYVTDPALLADIAIDKMRLPKFGWRQAELINLLYANPGGTREEFAEALGVSVGWVKNLFDRLFKKFEVHNKAHLLQELTRLGYRPIAGKPQDQDKE